MFQPRCTIICMFTDCHVEFDVRSVVQLVGEPTGEIVMFAACPACGRAQAREIDHQAALRLKADYLALMADKVEESVEPTEQAECPEGSIGLTVQGFRIDLDAVTDLSDIELYWGYQERSGKPFPVMIEA